MEVILLEKVQNLGDLGEVVSVKNGFGRNFLIPQGKAVRATSANREHFEQQKAELLKKAQELLTAAQSRAEAIEGFEQVIKANASAEGKLYGSIGPREIAEALTESGQAVQKSEVVMGEGVIRTTGEFEINLSLHADVNTTIKLVVEPEE